MSFVFQKIVPIRNLLWNRAKRTRRTDRYMSMCFSPAPEQRTLTSYTQWAPREGRRRRYDNVNGLPTIHESPFSTINSSELPYSPKGSSEIGDPKGASQNVHEIPVGDMNTDTWQSARKHVIRLAKRGDAVQAEKLLDRLVAEAESLRVSPFNVNATLYNACLHSWAKIGKPYRALTLLRTMESRYQSNPTAHLPPDTISYNAVLNAWAAAKDEENESYKVTTMSHQQHVEDLIAEMERLSQSDPKGSVQPDTQSYNLVMLCYANRGREYGSAQKAEDWLLKLAKMAATSASSVEPDPTSFNIVLKAWGTSEETGAPERAHQILQLMIRLFREGNENCRPDSVSFATVASAYGTQRSQLAASKAHEVLRQAQELNLSDVDLTKCFNCVLQAWARSGAADAGDRAEELLFQPQPQVHPDVYSYTSCVEAHATTSGPEKAEEFLHRMLQSYKTGDTKVLPNTFTFNSVIRAWVKSNREEGARKANELLSFMDKLAEETPDSYSLPDSVTYDMCINAWINNHTTGFDGSTQALALLERAENTGIRLGNFAYNIVIKGLSKSPNKGSASKAVEVLKRMEHKSRRGNKSVQPDVITYNVVLKALANARDIRAAKAALDIVDRMEREYQRTGNRTMEPCIISYTSVVQAWVNARVSDPQRARVVFKLFETMKKLDGDPERYLSLDTTAFRSVLNAVAGVRKKDVGSLCLHILEEMQTMQSLGRSVTPDCGCYAPCIVDMARHNESEKAHELLTDVLEQYHNGNLDRVPNRRVFVEVIESYARRPNSNSCHQTQQIVDMMENFAGEVDGASALEPGIMVYIMLVDMLVKSGHEGAPEHAQQLLLEMENKRKLGIWRTGADQISWNSVIHAWARSRHPDKAKHARGLLDQMNDISREDGNESTLSPDAITYNTVLNACAFTKARDSNHRREVLQIALDTFKALEESSRAKPDHLSYGTMMKVYKHLVESESESAGSILSTFDQACRAGQVGKLVIRELQSVLPHVDDSITKQLKGYSSTSHREILPSSWTCNLRER